MGAQVPAEDTAAMFPKGFVELRPWFKLAPQPDYE